MEVEVERVNRRCGLVVVEDRLRWVRKGKDGDGGRRDRWVRGKVVDLWIGEVGR